MAIEFSPGFRQFLEVWVGADVASGNEDLGYDSRLPYKDLAQDLRALSGAMQGAIARVGYSMPPEVGDRFVGAMRLFVDDNGVNHLYRLADELDKTGQRQVGRSMKLAESKIEILIEFAIMNLELALLASLSVFTGGTSLAETYAVKARSALSILLIMQRMGRAAPTPFTAVLEALEEAFTSFFAQFLSMYVPDSPDRRRTKFDWKDIGQSAFVGFLAGLFGGALGEVYHKFIAKNFKDKHWLKEGLDVPFEAVNEGQAEMFASGLAKLAFEGKFALSWQEFWMSGVSGGLTSGAEIVVGAAGLGLYHQFFQKTPVTDSVFRDKPGALDAPDAVRDNENHPLTTGVQDGTRIRETPGGSGVGQRVGFDVPDSVRLTSTLSGPPSSPPPPPTGPVDPAIPGPVSAEVGLGAVPTPTPGPLEGADVPGLTDVPTDSDLSDGVPVLSDVSDLSDGVSVLSDVSDVSDLSDGVSVFSDVSDVSDLSDLSDGVSVFSDVSDASSFTDVEDDLMPVSETGMDTDSGLVTGGGAATAGVAPTAGAMGMSGKSGLSVSEDLHHEPQLAGGEATSGDLAGADTEVRGPAPSGARQEGSTAEHVQSPDETEVVLEGTQGIGQDGRLGTSGPGTPTLSGTPLAPVTPTTSGTPVTSDTSRNPVTSSTPVASGTPVTSGTSGAPVAGSVQSSRTSNVISAAEFENGRQPVSPQRAGEPENGRQVRHRVDAATGTDRDTTWEGREARTPAPESTPVLSGPAASEVSRSGAPTSGTASTQAPSVTPASSSAPTSSTQTPDKQSVARPSTVSGDTRSTVAPPRSTTTTHAAAVSTVGGRPVQQAASGIAGPSVESTAPRIVVERVGSAVRSGALPVEAHSGTGSDRVPRSRQFQTAVPSPNQFPSGGFVFARGQEPSGGGRPKSRWDAPESVMQEITDSGGRRIGVMSFDAEDLEWRRDVYGKLAEQKDYAQWRRDDQDRLVGDWRDLPEGFGESFFLALHHDETGFRVVRPDGSSVVWTAEELGQDLRRRKRELSGFKQITLLSCTAGAQSTAANRARTDAQIVADVSGWTVNAPVGRVAFAEDGIHLAHDADGNATAWRTFHPNTTPEDPGTAHTNNTLAPSAPEVIPDSQFPSQGWNASPAEDPATPASRFPEYFYRTDEWYRLSERYEKAVGEVLAADPRVIAEARKA
ncbi:hypothetical protein ACI2L1_44990, partial [Streptomyces sp. NPDC019531]